MHIYIYARHDLRDEPSYGRRVLKSTGLEICLWSSLCIVLTCPFWFLLLYIDLPHRQSFLGWPCSAFLTRLGKLLHTISIPKFRLHLRPFFKLPHACTPGHSRSVIALSTRRLAHLGMSKVRETCQTCTSRGAKHR